MLKFFPFFGSFNWWTFRIWLGSPSCKYWIFEIMCMMIKTFYSRRGQDGKQAGFKKASFFSPKSSSWCFWSLQSSKFNSNYLRGVLIWWLSNVSCPSPPLASFRWDLNVCTDPAVWLHTLFLTQSGCTRGPLRALPVEWLWRHRVKHWTLFMFLGPPKILMLKP